MYYLELPTEIEKQRIVIDNDSLGFKIITDENSHTDRFLLEEILKNNPPLEGSKNEAAELSINGMMHKCRLTERCPNENRLYLEFNQPGKWLTVVNGQEKNQAMRKALAQFPFHAGQDIPTDVKERRAQDLLQRDLDRRQKGPKSV